MYSLYIIQLLLHSYEQEIWFYLNKNLLQKRLTGGWGSITKQNTGNLLLLLIYAEYHNSPFILLKQNVSNYGKILFAFFVFVILNNTTLCQRQS